VLACSATASGRTQVCAQPVDVDRCLVEVAPPLDRVPLLFAAVDIHLAANDHAADALAAEAGGAVALAAGDPPAALVSLRRAWQLWQGIAAPYEEARVRVRVGLACRALGDEDAAALELDAARGAFARLGAGIDLAEVDELTAAPVKSAHGLTPRQLEVLRLVAAGQTNRRPPARPRPPTPTSTAFSDRCRVGGSTPARRTPSWRRSPRDTPRLCFAV
jgi:hypothetical protein